MYKLKTDNATKLNDLPLYKHPTTLYLLLAFLFVITAFSTSINSNNQRKTVLGPGKYTVGEDINACRYKIVAQKGSGEVESNKDKFDFYLGKKIDNDLGQVTSYTTNLSDNQKITVTDLKKVKLIPVATRRYHTKLSAGDWVVGKDVKSGRYVFRSKQGDGQVYINDDNVDLGRKFDNNSGQVSSYTTSLKKGDKISFDNVNSIQLKPVATRKYRTQLSSGDWLVGKDIKPGRYKLVSKKGDGQIQDQDLDIDTPLGTKSTKDYYSSYTTTLKKGQLLNVYQMEDLVLIPIKPRSYQTDLTTGDWTVGKDIKPGKYLVKAVQDSGEFKSNDLDVDENLGTVNKASDDQVTQAKVKLKKGQVISVDLDEVQLVSLD